MTVNTDKFQPFGYVTLNQVMAPYPIIVQISFDKQTLIFSNRLQLSQVLNIEQLVDEYIGERTDWFKKYPNAYKRLAQFILQIEHGDIAEFTSEEFKAISHEIKASDSLLQIRALYHLDQSYKETLLDENKITQKILEEGLSQAFNVDEYLRSVHYYLSQIDHSSRSENSEIRFDFKFKRT